MTFIPLEKIGRDVGVSKYTVHRWLKNVLKCPAYYVLVKTKSGRKRKTLCTTPGSAALFKREYRRWKRRRVAG